uniref:Uncharacterized protein n=1 Tax=viral metagenome TaxID=1070528 RepID=A0A6M3MA61_9ZZZZ
MNVPMDYHILFLAMSFILFIITIFLIFIETTLEKAVGATILIMVNLALTMICGYLFSAVDIYGYDSTGAIVHNIEPSMYPFTYLYLVLGYINICLLLYCGYLFVRKPWIERMENDEVQYPSEIY